MTDVSFVKSSSSASSTPPLCSTLPNGNNQWHFNDLDKANCLNDYFASILTVKDKHTQLPPFQNLLITLCHKYTALNTK